MELFNTFNMTNDSIVMQQRVLNDNSTMNNVIPRDEWSNITAIILCALGLPGNVLVFAVYVRKMTTSTRVYMFALAVADLVVCVCPCILLSTGIVAILIYCYVFDASRTFYMSGICVDRASSCC